jgi:hypothetical protein
MAMPDQVVLIQKRRLPDRLLAGQLVAVGRSIRDMVGGRVMDYV